MPARCLVFSGPAPACGVFSVELSRFSGYSYSGVGEHLRLRVSMFSCVGSVSRRGAVGGAAVRRLLLSLPEDGYAAVGSAVRVRRVWERRCSRGRLGWAGSGGGMNQGCRSVPR